MMSIAKEFFYLWVTLITACYVVSLVAWRITLLYTTDQPKLLASLTPFTDLPLWTFLIAVPLLLIARKKYTYLHKMRINKCQPAPNYPHRDPIGLDWIVSMKRALQSYSVPQVWDGLFRDIGSTFWVHTTGDWLVMTNEPENVKALLATKFETWPILGIRQKLIILAIGPRGIFAVNGEDWHTARNLIRPSFVRNQIADLECTDRHVENFLKKLPRDGTKVDLQELLYMFTMDVSTDFMFGHSTNSLVEPTEEAMEFTKSFDYALLTAASRSRLGWIALLLPDKKLDRAAETCQRFVDKFVEEAQSQEKIKERPYVFMNEMIAAGAPQDYIRDQLLSMILGGRDTSASTLSSLFWVLARREDVYKKMREEVAELGGRRPSWEDLKGLKYLNMVLKETLRLWAPVTSNARVAITDTILPKGGGPDGQSPLFIPKGTNCRWSLYSLHRRKDIFGEDADEFRPERWETLRTTWEYLPFSGGPRICIGQQFALTQMSYLVTRVLQTFASIAAADDGPMLQQVGTTSKLVGGCWVTLTEV